MTLKEAIKKCKDRFAKAMIRNELYEAKIWKRYWEQLEVINTVLTAKKLTKKDLKP